MRQILLLFILIFTLAGCLFAQDTLDKTIRVKKNRKVLKSLDVYNYPKIDSKEKEGLHTESSKFDEKGNIILKSNFYNNTNETYSYNSSEMLSSVRVYNTYLKTYMYQDSLSYDEKNELTQKVRFRFNKLNAGGKDVATISTKGINYIPDSILFFETYRYDTVGRMTYRSNLKGKELSLFYYTYDSSGNQIRERAVSLRGKDSLIVINSTTYNEAREPVKYVSTNSSGEILESTINKFNEKGQKTETSIYDGSFNLRQNFKFIFDLKGNMIEQLYYDFGYTKGKGGIVHAYRSSESKITYVHEFY